MWFYTYILENERGYQYTGYTHNLEERLQRHNDGEVKSTAKFKPWKIACFTAFPSKDLAMQFERYLKSGSGTRFRHIHLTPKLNHQIKHT